MTGSDREAVGYQLAQAYEAGVRAGLVLAEATRGADEPPPDATQVSREAFAEGWAAALASAIQVTVGLVDARGVDLGKRLSALAPPDGVGP